jgi:hypothetical protein
MAIIPKPLQSETINGLREQPQNYEAHRKSVGKINEIVSAMGPGIGLSAAQLNLSSSLGSGAKILAFSGTVKRGTFSIQIGTAGVSSNPSVSLSFPSGTYDAAPFAQVTQNGGTGTLPFTWAESTQQLTITLTGLPTVATTYIFRYLVTN